MSATQVKDSTNVPPSPNMRDVALEYVRRGWSVIPTCSPNEDGSACRQHSPPCTGKDVGKRPLLAAWKTYQSRRPTEVEVDEWWTKRPDANVAVIAGAVSGDLLVLDADDAEAVALVEARCPAAGTAPCSRTPRGGRHYFLRLPVLPQGVVPRNATKVGGYQLDLRTSGGYAVVAKSRGQGNRPYEWIRPPTAGVEIPPLDGPLLDMLVALWREDKPGADKAGGPPPGAPPASGAAGSGAGTTKTTAYGAGALKSAAKAIAAAQIGQRNDVLFKTAASIFELVAGGEIDDQEAETTLRGAGIGIGLQPLEIQKTIASARAAGFKKPRVAPNAGTWGSDAEDPAEDAADDAWSQPLDASDLGNARTFAADHSTDLRYVHDLDKWYRWNGCNWTEDSTQEVMRRAAETVDRLRLRGQGIGDPKARTAWLKHARASRAEPRIRRMVGLAKADPKLALTSDALDVDPWLLNLKSGTLDLRTGKLRPANRNDYITHCLPFEYDPKATCPRWILFLQQVFRAGGQPDVELVRYIQRAVGYTLVGLNPEQVLFFLCGLGRNGKTTFLRMLRMLVSSLGVQADFTTFVVRRSEGPRNDIARMAGARLVCAVEGHGTQQIDTVAIKQITGGDIVAARFLHREFREFVPTFKIWIAVNHPPNIVEQDKATWRRIHLIPFTTTIPKAAVDEKLLETLEGELPGILNWALAGLAEWQTTGLNPPASVTSATQEYREGQDTFGDFLAEKCILGPEQKVEPGKFVAAYKTWAEETGERPLSLKFLWQRLRERGLAVDRAPRTNKARPWTGIGLRDPTYDNYFPGVKVTQDAATAVAGDTSVTSSTAEEDDG